MAKPRIIIADTDENYIIPLQLKFAEDFYEKVDLEIITDPNYFSALFSAPQRADILIVSEDLYDQSIQKHNISYVFLMTESYEEDRTDVLTVSRIYKYTSIKEIFNEVIGKSQGVFELNQSKLEPQIVVVCSASGGTGKTSVAMGLSGALTRQYKRVLYIHAGRLQTFQHLLENPSPIAASDVYAKLTKPTETIYDNIKHVIRKEQFSYLPPFKAALMSLGIHYSIYRKLALSARKSGDYDFVIVDADTAFDEEKAALLSCADKVVVVTDQSVAAVSATNTLVSNINGASGEKYIFICNKFEKEAENALISPRFTPKFTVTDYVEKIRHCEKMKAEELAREASMQSIAFLII